MQILPLMLTAIASGLHIYILVIQDDLGLLVSNPFGLSYDVTVIQWLRLS